MKRASGLIIIEVSGANPNGNPDWDNNPRQFLGGECGYITPMSLKWHIRNTLADHRSPCFREIAKRLKLDPERHHIFESKNRGYEEMSQSEASKAVLALAKGSLDKFFSRYLDARLLGCTFLETKDNQVEEPEETPKPKKGKAKEKESNGKEPKFRCVKTGCVTISPAVSVAPISTEEVTISKKAPLRDVDQDLAPSAYKFVRHGLYVARISVNPHVAHHTHATDEDVDVLKFVLPHAFQMSSAGGRPSGSIWPIHIWWREHTNPLGSFNEYEWFKSLMPTRKGDQIASTSIDDYVIPNGKDFGAVDLTVDAWK